VAAEVMPGRQQRVVEVVGLRPAHAELFHHSSGAMVGDSGERNDLAQTEPRESEG